ncbi:MAG: DUF1614 domain-containing protein [Methanothermobacter sp.]|nr:DUF1614 domain-containing protein [Methanothermobacter tenebrarum]MDI6881701.1 DUF1614 domain-containing protein [Methanothermobacter sp.]MDX9693087.1 DUF1614 domain-containing protein [Methanothermobacter sp.]HOQ20498.1 DUF1614 domain-containing protein [Methanothermobacter sp.]
MENKKMNKYHGFHHKIPSLFLFILLLLLLPFLFIVFAGGVMLAFTRLGIPPTLAYTLFWVSLIGSSINIPIKEWTREVYQIREINFFGINYRIPYHGQKKTVLAVNLGGAIIPLTIVTYEILRLSNNPQLILNSIIAMIIVATICKIFARPIKGLGIAIPAFIPPIVAAITALIIGGENPVVVAYISGTIGTLIGADILNLHKIKDLGAPIASIGGAGTFDGIFLTGIIAVLLI